MPFPSSPILGPPFLPDTTAVADVGGGAYVLGVPQAQATGIAIAFDAPTLAENPLWTRLDDQYRVVEWKIFRGRAFELDKTVAGTAVVTLIDENGVFDPTNSGSPFAGKLEPMKQASINLWNPVSQTWSMVFRGYVADWNYDLHVTENYCVVTLELVDAMDLLAAAEMIPPTWGDVAQGSDVIGDAFFAVDAQVADRINQVLDDAGWPATMREIFSGNIQVRKTIYPYRSQALTAIQDAADAEFPGVANVYVQKDGTVTFHGRLARFKPLDVQYDIDIWRCGDTAAVAADSTRAIISELGFNRGKANIFNSVLAVPQGIKQGLIELQRIQDSASIATYGERSLSFENLLVKFGYTTGNDANDECQLYADYYVDNYKSARTRVNRVTFRRLPPSHPNADRVWRLMCGVDISDIIRLKTTHKGGGGFDEDFYVEGVRYVAAPLSDEFLDVTLELDVSPRGYYDANPFE